MNIHELSGLWINWVFVLSWTRLTVHEFHECLICCSGTLMNRSWTHLMNVHECSLTIWLMNLSSSRSFINKPWFMNYLSSWPFMNNTCSWTNSKFMNICCSRIFMNRSWTRWWTFMNVHSFLFTNIHELLMNVHEQFMIISPGPQPFC